MANLSRVFQFTSGPPSMMLGESFRSTSTRASGGGRWGVERHNLRQRTGYEIESSAEEFRVVQMTDGRLSVGELLDGAA